MLGFQLLAYLETASLGTFFFCKGRKRICGFLFTVNFVSFAPALWHDPLPTNVQLAFQLVRPIFRVNN